LPETDFLPESNVSNLKTSMKKKTNKKLDPDELQISSFITALREEEEKGMLGQSGQPCGGTYNINCTGGFICTHFCIDSRIC
jgi:predicted nucleotide-binding protein (sugar kinase/HSP70/actin superfamily)